MSLMTGRRPYRTAGHPRLEVERMVCEQEPERPSLAFSATFLPGSESGGLRRALEGDLDTVVLKAMRKEPERRYGSVKDFSEDIQHHLGGLPVQARNPSLFYRSSRFLQRHKESFATAMVGLILVGVIGAWTVHRLSSENPAPTAPAVRVRPSIAVLGFKNLAGRAETAWISTALSEMLTSQLGAGEEVRTIAGDTVSQTKIDLNLSDTEAVTTNALERVRANLGSGDVVVGSYANSAIQGGGQLRLDARLEDTATDEPSWQPRNLVLRMICRTLLPGPQIGSVSDWGCRRYPNCNPKESRHRCLPTWRPCGSIPKVWSSFGALMR